MMLGIKLEHSIAHYRESVVLIGSKEFDERDLREKVDAVMTRMVEIFFEQERVEDFKALIMEACQDSQVRRWEDER